MRKYLSRLPRSTEELIQWHERYISPATLVVGFALDAFIFQNVDLLVSNILLFVHLVIAALGILLFHLIQTGKLSGAFFLKIIPFVPSVIQFSFGALFSGFVILYSQSAAYATSWIFIAILALLLIGNERFRTLYTQLPFQSAVYFLVLISFLVFFLPVIFLRIGTEMFLVSQALGVGVMFLLLRVFGYFVPAVLAAARWSIFRSIAAILLVFNVMYVTNVIPPIPLALKDAGVFHSVKRVGTEYVLKAEPLQWYEQYLRYNTVFHRAPGETVYVYTAVFAPTKLSTNILHEWEYYDDVRKEWVRSSTYGFPITGGRDGGYRGYTLRESIEEGEWRVNVRTASGKLIGRVRFSVEAVETAVETIEERG